MASQQRVPCPRCEGYGRVAIILVAPDDPFRQLVPDLCNRPMAVTVARARQLLQEFDVRRSGPRRPVDPRAIVVRSLASRLDATPCPHCGGTGVAFTLTFGEPRRDPVKEWDW